jgi:signal transduction histidine kinase
VGSLDSAAQAAHDRFGTEAGNPETLASLGRELHDGPIQGVVIAVLELETLKVLIEQGGTVDPTFAVAAIDRSQAAARGALDALRATVRRLTPPEGPLVAADPADGGLRKERMESLTEEVAW